MGLTIITPRVVLIDDERPSAMKPTPWAVVVEPWRVREGTRKTAGFAAAAPFVPAARGRIDYASMNEI